MFSSSNPKIAVPSYAKFPCPGFGAFHSLFIPHQSHLPLQIIYPLYCPNIAQALTGEKAVTCKGFIVIIFNL
jgi:hypothetical protein